MKEELNLTLHDVDPYSMDEFKDRIEYTFWKKVRFETSQLRLNEGQRISRFSETKARNIELAYGFNRIADSFFNKKPFR